MAINNIIKGEPDWHLKINNNISELEANDTATSSKIGVLSINGITETDLATAIKNDRSQLSEIVQQNNNTITYGYDSNGNVQIVTEKDVSNNVIKTVTYTYNASGDVTTSVTVSNGKTVATTYNYDTSGNIINTVNVLS